ncbi:hypothetical protein MMC07_002231 [Pseudocyphellaria aurata]|nr:hypothetical protein [Pseudocyphellaria aurata]
MDFLQPTFALETDELKQSLHTRALEVAYERSFLGIKDIYNEEESRRFQVQILLLEDEKDDLHTELAQSDQRVEHLENNEIRTQNESTVAAKSLEKARLDLRAKSRENELLKTELDSLQNVTSESTKLLTEKLSLAREIASLKPEIEHLRSQAALHQSLLSEKLTLQRQLATVQVELETEKRSTQRIQAKEGRLKAEDAKLESRIESLHAELAQERRQREKSERDAQKAAADWESKKATFESRLDAFRNKLRVTKEQLKATQADLHSAQQTTRAASVLSGTTGPEKDVCKMVRKRTSAQLDADSVIGTPGLLPARKKNIKSSTLPGDKSTFSITPFLNRSTSVTVEDADQEAGSPKTAHHLEKVAELEEDSDAAEITKTRNGETSTVISNEQFDDGKKKRRKLFGGDLSKTLFDEDEEVTTKNGTMSKGKSAFSGPKSRPRIGLAPAKSSFGAISPLKKDKRSVVV